MEDNNDTDGEELAKRKRLRTSIEQNIENLDETITVQNDNLIEFLTKHTTRLRKFKKEVKESDSVLFKFPVDSVEKLVLIEEEIKDGQRDSYVAAMKAILKDELFKNFERILARQLCLSFNVDGVSGKMALKEYKGFLSALKEAIASISDNADRDLRKAFQVVKKRIFRLHSMRNKQSKLLESEEAQ